MNKENKVMKAQKNGAGSPVEKDEKAQMPCKFEELKDEFLIQREIGRGKFSASILVIILVDSFFI